MGQSKSKPRTKHQPIIEKVKDKIPEEHSYKIKINDKAYVDATVSTCSPTNHIHPDLVDRLQVETIIFTSPIKCVADDSIEHDTECYVNITFIDGRIVTNVRFIVCGSSKFELVLGHEFFKMFRRASVYHSGITPSITAHPSEDRSVVGVKVMSVGVYHNILNVPLDTSITLSLIDRSFAERLQLRFYTELYPVTQYLNNRPIRSDQACLVRLYCHTNLYERQPFRVVDNLHANMILGLDFMVLHKHITFEYDGSQEPLVFIYQKKDAERSQTLPKSSRKLLFATLTRKLSLQKSRSLSSISEYDH